MDGLSKNVLQVSNALMYFMFSSLNMPKSQIFISYRIHWCGETQSLLGQKKDPWTNDFLAERGTAPSLDKKSSSIFVHLKHQKMGPLSVIPSFFRVLFLLLFKKSFTLQSQGTLSHDLSQNIENESFHTIIFYLIQLHTVQIKFCQTTAR